MAVHATKLTTKKANLQNAAFYGDVSNHNPVLLAFEQELECFLKFFHLSNPSESVTRQANNVLSRRLMAISFYSNFIVKCFNISKLQ